MVHVKPHIDDTLPEGGWKDGKFTDVHSFAPRPDGQAVFDEVLKNVSDALFIQILVEHGYLVVRDDIQEVRNLLKAMEMRETLRRLG